MRCTDPSDNVADDKRKLGLNRARKKSHVDLMREDAIFEMGFPTSPFVSV